MNSSREAFDVAIVGAGPAGSSAAIRLARTGRTVLLVDKATFPREKLCGEFVSPECLDHFEELGVSEDLFRLSPPKLTKTIFHSSKGRSCSIPNEWLSTNGRESVGISRAALDNIFVKKAAASAAEVRESTSLITPLIEDGNARGLRLSSFDRDVYEVEADLLIDATGRGRFLARNFDSSKKIIKAPQVAFKAHIRGARIEVGACELFRFDGGYGGSSAIESGIQDLCFVVESEKVRAIGNDPKTIFEKTYLTNPRAREVFRDCEVVSEWLSVPLSSYGVVDPVPFPGVLAIGDAAAFIDPFTGSGIALALESSKIACETIIESRGLSEIEKRYRRMHAANFEWRLRACAAIRILSRSQMLTELIIGVLGSSEIARRLVTRMTRSSSLRNHDLTSA
jgi:flavin-dependent dehydrogenase